MCRAILSIASILERIFSPSENNLPSAETRMCLRWCLVLADQFIGILLPHFLDKDLQLQLFQVEDKCLLAAMVKHSFSDFCAFLANPHQSGQYPNLSNHRNEIKELKRELISLRNALDLAHVTNRIRIHYLGDIRTTASMEFISSIVEKKIVINPS